MNAILGWCRPNHIVPNEYHRIVILVYFFRAFSHQVLAETYIGFPAAFSTKSSHARPAICRFVGLYVIMLYVAAHGTYIICNAPAGGKARQEAVDPIALST